jgi:hypothetical protein
VTIDADRYLVGLLFPQLTSDDLQMHPLDLGVALHAGSSDVVAIDAGRGVLVRQDIVGGVTASTYGSDDEASPKETVSVDRLRVILQDVSLANRPELGNLGPLLVAGAAKRGNIHHVGASILVAGWQDVVFSMTGRAIGREVFALSKGSAVEASLKFFHRLVVAHAAVHRRETIFMREILDVGVFVARDTSDVDVNGIGKVSLVHIER